MPGNGSLHIVEVCQVEDWGARPEGIVSGQNGWLLGKGEAYTTEQDREELFRLLETQILPVFFERKTDPEGVCPLYSRRWVGMMKNSIETLTEKFNTDRMLAEYVEKMYLPAVRHSAKKGAGQPLTSF